MEKIFRVSNKLATSPAFYQSSLNLGSFKTSSLDTHFTHTVPALEALIATFTIGGYALQREYGLSDVGYFFPHLVPAAVGPLETENALVRPMLFWPITSEWGHPDLSHALMAVQRYARSERIAALFGGEKDLKNAVLQMDCYIDWNSWLMVESLRGAGEPAEYLRSQYPDILFEYRPNFMFEPLSGVMPLMEHLWTMAGSTSTNHLNGWVLDQNLAQRYVDMGPQKRKEFFARFALYVQKEQATIYSSWSRFPPRASWPAGLNELMKSIMLREQNH
ncbi:MAG TPA: hypothetical protein VI895_08255 [Bdellovibrionota bacterium]|nr:hypothetical protein [Bdellovibrionota bacterium]